MEPPSLKSGHDTAAIFAEATGETRRHMNPPIGFIITSYSLPQQLERLVARLNVVFNHPPIVCHHNFHQCALATEHFPKNVSFVRPHLQTGWGTFSTVLSVILALEQLYAPPETPDWFVLLSGSDYPITTAGQVLKDLQTGGYDAHVGHVLIDPDALETDWQKMAFRRYGRVHFRLPFRKSTLIVRNALLAKIFLPFSKTFQCYAGSFWFSANRRAVRHILDFHKTRPQLARHYAHASLPDESYFITILKNAAALKVNNNTWRYTDWSAGGDHPKTLGLADLPKILGSSAHFARKFDMARDRAVLDELDRIGT